MKISKLTGVRRTAAWGALVSIAAAAACLVLFAAAPILLRRGGETADLGWLQARGNAIRADFDRVLSALDERRAAFAALPPAASDAELFGQFQAIGLDPETEGIAAVDGDARPLLWFGSVLDLREFVPEPRGAFLDDRDAAFLVGNRASVYLVAVRPPGPGPRLIHFRLIAFVPRIRSPILREFHFFGPARPGVGIEYWDFRENVEGFETVFSRHGDEYVGRAEEIRTLFFPLRNRAGRILATVSLSSPPRPLAASALREGAALTGLAALVIALVFLAAIGLGSVARAPRPRALKAAALLAAAVAGLRALFIAMSSLEPVRSWPVFSPARAGFRSAGSLTASPADIFLTALALAALVGITALPGLRRGPLEHARRPALPPSLAVQIAILAVAVALLAAFQTAAATVVDNSNVNLLRFSPSGSFVLLQAALLGLLIGVVGAVALLIRANARFFRGCGPALVIAAVLCAAHAVMDGGRRPPAFFGLEWVLLAAVLAAAIRPPRVHRRFLILGLFFLGILYLGRTLEHDLARRTAGLAEGLLRTAVRSQASWGRFIVTRSFPDIERNSRQITAFFRNPEAAPDFANTLWSATLMAEFNWYSSLEITSPSGEVLSRFSLNLPRLPESPRESGEAASWTLAESRVALPGGDMDVLIAGRDWVENGTVLGRIAIGLSLDPEQLPFLYSANPYFQLIRRNPLPSLDQFDIGFAVFDRSGRPIYNPLRLSAGLPAAVREALDRGAEGTWAVIEDGSRSYRGYHFEEGDRVYAFLLPRRTFESVAVDILKLLFFDGALVLLVLGAVALAGGRVFGHPLRSFSRRVYGAFLAIAVIPLLLFTFFTRDLFDRVFTERYVREAAARAGYARSLLEDALREPPASPAAPGEDLAYWISATIGADVNLYRDGRLAASSRREFFDAGILPELLDGGVYYRITRHGLPYVAQRTRIGDYAFHTLTVPFAGNGRADFIALPFPLQREETAAATRELAEFLLFLSVFFAGLVVLFARGIRSMIVVPVRKLLAGTREVGLGNLEVSIEHRSRDEMMTLIQGFNAMTRSLRAQQQELADLSKKVAWAEMARKVAHEIKNPLTPIQLSAEHLLKVFEDRRGDFEKTLRESLSYIIGEVENLRRIAQDFMAVARETDLRLEPCDLREILDETLQPFRKLPAERIRFGLEFAGEGFGVRADPGRLRTALRNLIINAIEAVPGRGAIDIRAVRRGDRLVITIRDTGPGLAAGVKDRVFEPYFSTKSVGTGLGLPIARKIVEDHGGVLRLDSGPGEGTTVTIELPAAD